MSGKRHHVYIAIGLIMGAAAGVAADWIAGPAESGPAAVSTQPSEAPGASLREGLHWFTYNVTDSVGKVFLRLIFMVVVPLVFCALTLGVVEIGDIRRLGRIGVRTLGYTLVLSSIAVILGVSLVNFFRPGESLPPEQRDALRAQYSGNAAQAVEHAKKAKSVRDTLLDIIPENPLQEMVGALDGSAKGGGMLAVMFFALVFGAAITLIPNERARPLVDCIQAVFDVCMVVIGMAMRIAPVAVACLVFSVTARVGADVLKMLLGFALTALAGMAVQIGVIYPLMLKTLGRTSPGRFFRDISDVMVTAFATSSSNATLPTSLRCAEQDLKLPKEIGHFVLTVGATGNQNGTALYEGVVVLFLAQVFGVELSFAQQLMVVLMSVLAGVGTAGVPGGSLPLIAVVCSSVGVPADGIGIILGIDRILDMVRTVLNVVGDLVLAVCVSKGVRPAPAPAM
ncbi:MAG: dicarboxylate/amino acid:cation symporter [Planctomycetota bacterium]|nr:MAG: dicarboxylate/amino acid:cation symporter [Planctomycetota bacterium]